MENLALDTLAAKCRCLSLFGMCKNAGKTTALNFLINKLCGKFTLGITSVGRDGESVDIVTGTSKPLIYLPDGTLAATAAKLLTNCTATKEILAASGLFTQLGEIIVFRSVGGGFAEIAGPSLTSDLILIRDSLFSLGAEKVLIDGAISRKSFTSAKITDGAILSAGASQGRDIENVVAETAHICGLFLLPQIDLTSPLDVNTAFDKDKQIIETNETSIAGLLTLKQAEYVYCAGAFTDNKLLPVINSSVKIAGKTVIIGDAAKILLSQGLCEMFYKKGGKLAVAESSPLIAVTVNPVSAYGWSFGASEFKERMQSAVNVPVFDLMN